MYAKYQDQVEFFMVYIKEAHPTDGRQSKSNIRENILIRQPKSLLERTKIAEHMCTELKIDLPPLVDTIDDKTNNAYSAAPDRLYLVGVNGKIIYKSDPGPWGFDARELEREVEAVVSKN